MLMLNPDREFDVSSDVQEPVQTVSLLPSSPKAASSSTAQAKARMKNSLRSRSRSQTPAMHHSVRSSSRIALDDDDDENSEDDYLEDASFSRHRSGAGPAAVTFTFGIDTRNAEDEGDGRSVKLVDWKPLSLYTLCSNGDVYALCPFMPKNA
jgi:nucleoporin NUP82